jgi:hypothetical protein
MISIQEQLGLDDEAYCRLKLFNRYLISYNDFKQAHEIASLLVSGDYYAEYPGKNRTLVIALNMAAIVAYSRPFLDSRGELAHNRLPDRALEILNAKEKDIHNTVLNDRHTIMAHSDADANEVIPLVIEVDGKDIVYPRNASPYARPLLKEVMQTFTVMSLKMREYCFKKRMEMEPDMLLILPRAQIDDNCET